jgi:capsular polysaccharide biosynthesis protein
VAERGTEVRSTVALLRRRWPVLVVAGLAGLGLGGLYAALTPPALTSRSLVLLTGGGGSTTASPADIATQIRVVMSTPVLERAGRSVTPALSAQQVLDHVEVQAVTSQLIEIDAVSARGAEARSLAQGVADAYVQSVLDNARSVTGETVGDLRARAESLDARVKGLQRQITATEQRGRRESPTSAAGVRDAQLASQLTAEQADIALQLDKVKSDLAAAGTLSGARELATVVQPATPASGPGRTSDVITAGLVGLMLMIGLAAAVMTLRERRDPRLRLRDDLADAVGTSVLADVRSRAQKSVAAWWTLLETYQAPAVDGWAFRQVLRALSTLNQDDDATFLSPRRLSGRLEHPRSLTVVSFSGDSKGLAVGPQLAAFAAGLGIKTRLVVATEEATADALRAACSSGRVSELRPGLVVDVGAKDASDTVPWTEFAGAADPPENSLPSGRKALPADDSFDALLVGASDPRGRLSDDEWPEGVDTDDPEGDDVDVPHREGAGGDVHDEVAAEHVKSTASTLEPVGPTAEVTAFPEAGWRPAVVPKHSSVGLTVVITVAARKDPSMAAVPRTGSTLLAISPGAASREELARLAVALDDTGRRLDGIVVADPDHADRTTGRRTLDERTRHVPLPVRETGTTPTGSLWRDRSAGR